MAFGRTHPLLFATIIIFPLLLFLATVSRLGSIDIKNIPLPKLSTQKPLSFYEVAKKYGTDKINPHTYHNMYDKYIGPVRDKRLRFVEIGLGCGMGYGPGASYYTWLEYIPNVELYFIEYDADCAEKWREKTKAATVFTGDQADVEFLERFIRESGGNFDFIVDDGGHTMTQQKTSLDVLWKAVKPGGMYFCEDLLTSFEDIFGGNQPDTMMDRVTSNIEELTTQQFKHPYMSEVYSIDCMRQVCGWTKMVPGGIY